MIHKKENKLIGHCGFHLYQEGAALELAVHMNPEYWHSGYATEACQGCLKYAFETLKTERVVAIIDRENIASLKLVARLGFEDTGKEEDDAPLFELTKHRWVSLGS